MANGSHGPRQSSYSSREVKNMHKSPQPSHDLISYLPHGSTSSFHPPDLHVTPKPAQPPPQGTPPTQHDS
ncbi:unnamed protein product [Diplocarpon coronariae]